MLSIFYKMPSHRRQLLLAYLQLACLLKARQRRRRRSCWVREINSSASKREDEYEILFKKIMRSDASLFRQYVRMSPERFDHLLEKITPLIARQDTNFRPSVPAEKRLVITLRFLSRGLPQETLAQHFRVGYATVSNIVSECCSAIHQMMAPTYLSVPSTDQWTDQ